MANPFLTTNAAGLLEPEFCGPLLVEPLKMESVAMRVSSNVSTPSPFYRISILGLPKYLDSLGRGGSTADSISADDQRGNRNPKQVNGLLQFGPRTRARFHPRRIRDSRCGTGDHLCHRP